MLITTSKLNGIPLPKMKKFKLGIILLSSSAHVYYFAKDILSVRFDTDFISLFLVNKVLKGKVEQKESYR